MLVLEKIRGCNVLDSKLQLSDIFQLVDNLLIFDLVLLYLFESLGDLDVIHIKSLKLLVLLPFHIKKVHQPILLPEEKLLTSSIEEDAEHLLRDHNDIVERTV